MVLVRPRGTDLDLFERTALGPHLQRLLPAGRLDDGFRLRARALGEELLELAFRRLPPMLMFLTPAGERFGPFPLDLAGDTEEARLTGELHVPFPFPWTWMLDADARLELVDGGGRFLMPRSSPRWKTRERIPGTEIVVARRLMRGRRGLRPGPSIRGLPGRLGAALDLVRRAWKEAAAEICIHTRVVVPVQERGVVSYSLPDRPGTSSINVEGKDRVQLADDLLHETAHHRLHSLEEIAPLHRDEDEAVYYSPWRRALRPLHGILHATYTFAFRAELFRRMLDLPERLPRARLRRELGVEIASLQRSLVDLRDAQGRGLLTPQGVALRRALAARVARIRRA